MKNNTQLALFVPSSCTNIDFHDLMGQFRMVLKDDKTCLLRGRASKGLYELTFETKPGTFPVDTLMLSLIEWPTRAVVPAGPFDFDHTQYRMVVPTFRVYVDDHDCGLVWCEVPCPEDLRNRRIRAVCAFEVEAPGDHEIRLKIPAEENRLRWVDLERMEFKRDERRPTSLTKKINARLDHPRLFTNAEQLNSLTNKRDRVQEALLDNLLHQLESGQDNTYQHRTVSAALVGRLTGERRWIDEALQRTLTLCEKPNWGYHDVPEIMGWNNDRDAGMRMFETAVVYDWLYHELTEAQRLLIRDKLAYHAELAARVTLLQKGYWYTRAPEAHGQGLWFGFTAAALALVGEDPRAVSWVEWSHCNMIEALHHMPSDGIVEWFVFNGQWLILSTWLLDYALGKPLSGSFPYLRNFSKNVPKAVGLSISGIQLDKLSLLLFFLARRHRDRRAQADALLAGGLASAIEETNPATLDPLSLLAYDPALAPSTSTRAPLSFCSENGKVICRSPRRSVQFDFQCGSSLTVRQHANHGWIHQSWYHPQQSGSFSWQVHGKEVIPMLVGAYRQRTRDANLITIDGAGHRMDGRWLGGRIDLEKVSWLERFVSGPGVTYCHANSSTAYLSELGVLRLTRQWVFFHASALLVMWDRVETREPHQFAWHLHTGGTWSEVGPLAYVAEVGDQQVAVRAITLQSEDPLEAMVCPTNYVPSYGYGLNRYKTLQWQPEVHARFSQPPDFQELTVSPLRKLNRWELITVMGSETKEVLSAEVSKENLITSVTTAAGNCVLFQEPSPQESCSTQDGIKPLQSEIRNPKSALTGALDATVEAEVVVTEMQENQKKRWTFFGARSWQQPELCQSWEEPVNLVWREGDSVPRVLTRRRG